MSVRKPDIRFARAADRDLQDTLLYTRRTWGDTQRETYRSAIVRALQMLRDHPHSGHPRPDLFPDCRSLQVNQHFIYYHQPRADVITIVRILHHRQDASTLVNDPDSSVPDQL